MLTKQHKLEMSFAGNGYCKFGKFPKGFVYAKFREN